MLTFVTISAKALHICMQNLAHFLNQACAGHRPAHAWFLKIDPVWTCVCVCVSPPPRLLITSGVMWCDIDSRRLVKQVYSCYMATVVIIVNGHGLGIDTRHRH